MYRLRNCEERNLYNEPVYGGGECARERNNPETIILALGLTRGANHTPQVKLTRTQLAQKIETLGHSSFRVTFKKQIVSNDVADALANADLSSQAKRRKIVKNLMEGERNG